MGPSHPADEDNLEAMSAFYKYTEPFSSECRAFGRLQEAGSEELAVRCFGYVLLDADEEQAMMDQFASLELEFNGNCEYPGRFDMRSRFLGRDGRPPPIRGIVKAFGEANEPLRARTARKVLRDVIRLQQLGILKLDVAHRQLISGRIADFSTAVTVPHFVTTPALNPRLTPEDMALMEREAFQLSMSDYWDFDDMIITWNDDNENSPKDQLSSISAFPSGHGCRIKYNLRPSPARQRVYTYVDPRLYDWKGTGGRGSPGRQPKCSHRPPTRGAISKTKRQPRATTRPARWYYDCDPDLAARLKKQTQNSFTLTWRHKDGLIFPYKKVW